MALWESTGSNCLCPDSNARLSLSRFGNTVQNLLYLFVPEAPQCGTRADFQPEYLLLGTQEGINGYHMSLCSDFEDFSLCTATFSTFLG